jgi:hypothetical protein
MEPCKGAGLVAEERAHKIFYQRFMMWGFNGTARVLIEYTEKATNNHSLLEPVDVKKDRYGFVYAPTRNGDVPYDPVKNASAYLR